MEEALSVLQGCNKFNTHLHPNPKGEQEMVSWSVKRSPQYLSGKTLSQFSHKNHGKCTSLNWNETTEISLILRKVLWDSQSLWLVRILINSYMKDRQLTASLNTMLGIIHKLLVVICFVYCDAFICNSSTQSGSCLVSLQCHLPLQM